ncbi:MAG: hypothetical protein HY841_14220 [Bacteroidetes bacterium]|nr:hypothetical protein [Bacteroidota bacterium]
MKKNLTFSDRRNSPSRKLKHDAMDEVKRAMLRKVKKSKPVIVIAHPGLFSWQE